MTPETSTSTSQLITFPSLRKTIKINTCTTRRIRCVRKLRNKWMSLIISRRDWRISSARLSSRKTASTRMKPGARPSSIRKAAEKLIRVIQGKNYSTRNYQKTTSLSSTLAKVLSENSPKWTLT